MTPKRIARNLEKYCALCPANNYKETYDSLVPKTKFIELPADESQAKLSIVCPDGQQPIIKTLDNKGSKRMSPHQFDFKNNVLTILTHADSARIAFAYNETWKINRVQNDRIVLPEQTPWYVTVGWLLLFISIGIASMMILYWFLFKRKGPA
jgi:hypothetical protein